MTTVELDPDEPVAGEHGTRVSWGMPLWFAALCGRHEIAGLLLARGADVLSALADGVARASESVRHPGALGWVP